MGSETAIPAEGEVRAVAELLGRRPDEVAAIKLPGPGQLGESILTAGMMPSLDGFAPPARLLVRWEGAKYPHLAARYDSPEGSMIVISHETGPEIFFVLLTGAAAATTVIRGVNDFVERVRTRREKSGAQPEDAKVEPIQFLFVEAGRVRSREALPLDPPEGNAA